MLCDRCHKNEATIHTRQTINGVTEEQHLCHDCVQTMKAGATWSVPQFFMSQSSGYGGMSMGKLFEDFFAAPKKNVQIGMENERREMPKPCPACGMSWQDFQRNGLLGCATCYEHYGELMPDLLRRLHGNSKHVGKVPEQGQAHLAQKNKIEALREQLKQAVADEAFEQACRLRDEIRALSNQEEEAQDES